MIEIHHETRLAHGRLTDHLYFATGAIVTSDAGAAEQAVHTDTLPWPLRRPQRGSERRPQHEQQQGGKARKGGRKSKKAKLGSNPDSPDSDDHIVPEDLNYRLATPGR